MQVKIDTSEKYHVITILESHLTANMTELIENKLSEILKADVKNVVLNFQQVASTEEAFLKAIVHQQENFLNLRTSFISCQLQPDVKQSLITAELEDLFNAVPTLSEAIDMVQMEEIERELDYEE